MPNWNHACGPSHAIDRLAVGPMPSAGASSHRRLRKGGLQPLPVVGPMPSAGASSHRRLRTGGLRSLFSSPQLPLQHSFRRGESPVGKHGESHLTRHPELGHPPGTGDLARRRSCARPMAVPSSGFLERASDELRGSETSAGAARSPTYKPRGSRFSRRVGRTPLLRGWPGANGTKAAGERALPELFMDVGRLTFRRR